MADQRTLECDLIMKGGVTSGIVYPGAIARLARDYRIRSIGGTSAGAIGAAAAAAMEHGLITGKNAAAIADMAGLPAQLSQRTASGATRLDAMFAADDGLAPIFAAAKHAGKRPGGLGTVIERITGGWPRRAMWTVAMASAPWLAVVWALGWLAGRNGDGAAGMAAAMVLAGGLMVVAALNIVAAGRDAVQRVLADGGRLAGMVAGNGLGLATGMAATGDAIDGSAVPPLMQWLHDTLQQLSGLGDDVLTFGHLWDPDHPADASSLGERRIDLVLMASDLNRLQSVSFPFLPQNERLLFDEREWGRLFPGPVMAALAAHSWRPGSDVPAPAAVGFNATDIAVATVAQPQLAGHLRLLPLARHLPLIVGVRASMAFPGLFTPLPLWLLRWVPGDGAPRPELARVYLADGGITSNFPIHLFDAPLPGRPTFALNLAYPGDELVEERADAADAPDPDKQAGRARPIGARALAPAGDTPPTDSMAALFMPLTNRGLVTYYKAPATGSPAAQLLGLATRVVETARVWNDVGQFSQPGVRDRIVHIRLSASEGGFNLDMPATAIAAIAARGTAAGDALARRFHPASPDDPIAGSETARPSAFGAGANWAADVRLNWHNHRFVRMRTAIAGLEQLAIRIDSGWRTGNSGSPATTPSLADLIAHADGRHPAGSGVVIGYSRLDGAARQRLQALITAGAALAPLAGQWPATTDAPRPVMRYRLVPGGWDPAAIRISQRQPA